MKKVIFVAAIAIASIAVISCEKNNGCSRSEKGWIRDFTDSDSCGVLIELEDGTKLEPTNWSEHNLSSWEEGDLVWISYKGVNGSSKCGIGDIVEIRCISEREY